MSLGQVKFRLSLGFKVLLKQESSLRAHTVIVQQIGWCQLSSSALERTCRMQYRAITRGHRVVIRYPAESSCVTSANCRSLQRLPSSQSPKPPPHTLGSAAPQQNPRAFSGVASPPFHLCSPFSGDYSSFWTLHHTSRQQDCKTAPGISICIIAGWEHSFQSGPCPCL